MSVTIHTGDCIEVMRTLPAESVHCCVTSPPYYGLRDYDVEPTAWPAIAFSPVAGLPPLHIPAMTCCLGLEPEPWAFVGHLVLVFREVHRVLRTDGTLWLNIGDSYAGSWCAEGRTTSHGKSAYNASKMQAKSITNHPKRSRRLPSTGSNLKPKDLIGIPWMLAFALRADGWYLRQEIIWSKPNPMPESVRDRCTKAHESLFLLSKSPQYYFDQDAIAEQLAVSSVERMSQPNLVQQAGSARVPGKTNGPMKAVASKRNSFARKTKETAGEHGQKPQHREDREDIDYTGRRNKRSVWTVATQPFREAHYATFPVKLVEPCILAGSPAGGMVLDPFGGAGTTGLAAEVLGRDSLMIELNPTNVDMAERRTRQGGLALGATA